MGNAFSCVEKGSWDPHPNVTEPYRPTKEDIYMDMNQPLSHYFVSSGHNSYLTGNQLNSDSGTQTIEMCLTRGCRVIELDVYNEEKSGVGPVCKHGGTLTKPIAVRDCVRAVKKHAFTATPYPAIITIENHTNAENQKLLATILREELGDALFIPTPEQVGAMWLSPEALKNKVLIRTNLSKGAVDELKEIVYIANTKFTNWADKTAEPNCSSSSLNEGKLEAFLQKITGKKITGEHAPAKLEAADAGATDTMGEEEDDVMLLNGTIQEVFAYSKKHLLRVYPAGWRVGSSNFNPIVAWDAGASFAALNWQEWDEPLWINEGRFKDNGNCGYVLKPDYMLNYTKSFDPEGRQLCVHVYSACMPQHGNVMCYKDDVYVRMMVEGAPSDTCRQHTKTVNNSGRLVVDKTFNFNIKYPGVATLLVLLMDQDAGGVGDDCMGYFSLPVATLSEGNFKLQMSRKRKEVKGAYVKVRLSWEAKNPLASS